MHKLLKRQLRHIYGKGFNLESQSEDLQTLISKISTTYDDFDTEKRFTDHILDVSSDELNAVNKNLKVLNDNLEHEVQKEVKENRVKDLLLLQQSRHAQMGEMITMIAHQWRQPLSSISAIVGFIQVKKSLGEFDEEDFDEELEKISSCTQHLSKTIKDFREFFKEDKKESDITLGEVINSALEIVAPLLRTENIAVNIQCHSNNKISTYPNELKQVILNLIKNSQDAFMDLGTKDALILIKTYENEQYCFLEIHDNAGGIPEDILSKIFEPYFTTKGELNGTGLGLYMSKMIINDHCKGHIHASNIDGGACITLQLKK